MPIYEYSCADCSHQFETIQKVNEPRLTLCPKCGHNSLSKLISAAGFQLKGTGWYQTDFKTQQPVPIKAETNENTNKEPKLT